MKDDFYILKAIQDRKKLKKAKVIARRKRKCTSAIRLPAQVSQG
jgi:hypothetical protein